ncbi:MOSC domain-containing protein [Thalassoroseus pseudoceratinae]|uniref:MOSC domain-containing protein n=1 Tax=Thalassoroseus pseudoceratinae TaxID=2713176 RepID=UPI00141F9417|nr:MOSC domain-containing protein [Thalassoroseus pseudoceratinae]
MKTIEDYKSTLPQIGRLGWIGAAPSRRAPLAELKEAELQAGTGIVGEHHANSGQSKRQVTLIQSEHLPAVASLVHRESVGPGLLRRNLVVSDINLLALKDRRFRIGECLLEGSGLCVPCSLMEEKLGPGGYNAMRGHGGITAIVIQGGKIRVGDSVVVEENISSD